MLRLDLVSWYMLVSSGCFQFLQFLSGTITKKLEKMQKNRYDEYDDEELKELAYLELPTTAIPGTGVHLFIIITTYRLLLTNRKKETIVKSLNNLNFSHGDKSRIRKEENITSQ